MICLWLRARFFQLVTSGKLFTLKTIGLRFYYYVFTWNRGRYLGEKGYSISDIPPETYYKVTLTEDDNLAGVNFLVDWKVTEIDGYSNFAEVEEITGAVIQN